MQWRPVLVCSLVLLAGCGALVDGGQTANRETLTPAPVPEVTPTPERWPVAPGLTGTGVVDVDVLVAAHLAAIADRSFVWRERRGAAVGPSGSTANASVPLFEQTVARVESPTVYAVWTSRERVRLESGPRFVANYTEYADGRVRHVRYRLDGQTQYRHQTLHAVSASRSDYVGGAASDAIRRYLTVENATVTATRVDGRRYYRLVGDRPPRRGHSDVRNYTVSALVSSDGFVRSLDVSYVSVAAGTERRVRYAYTYTDVNETTVEPPAWYRDG